MHASGDHECLRSLESSLAGVKDMHIYLFQVSLDTFLTGQGFHTHVAKRVTHFPLVYMEIFLCAEFGAAIRARCAMLRDLVSLERLLVIEWLLAVEMTTVSFCTLVLRKN